MTPDPWADERCAHGHLQGIGCQACARVSRRLLAAIYVGGVLVVLAVLWLSMRG